MAEQDKIQKLLSEVGSDKEESMMEMMLLLNRALEERDEYTRGHSERVSQLAVLIGERLGFDAKRLEKLARGALLHDIGKIGIPDNILNKPGNFDPDERARMNKHPEKGHFLALNSHLLWDLIPMIRNHHENFDGTGYPDQLKGEEIPLEVRIVTLADFFDALATRRPYKEAFPKAKCLEMIDEMKGKKFDPQVVAAFHAIVDAFYEKTIRTFNENPPHADR